MLRQLGGFPLGALHHEPAAWLEDLPRRMCDALVKAASEECHARLEPRNFRLEPCVVVVQDVRRVRRNKLEGPRLARAEIAEVERDPTLEPDIPRILASHVKCLLRDIDSSHARTRMLVGDREGDRARAGSDVENARALERPEVLEAALDEHLGLGPGYENGRCDTQLEPAEAPVTDDVGKRLASATALDGSLESATLAPIEYPLWCGVQFRTSR